MKRIDITPAIEHALDAIERAEAAFVPGRDAFSVIEVHKVALAQAVLDAIALARPLDRLPQRAAVIRVDGSTRRKRRLA